MRARAAALGLALMLSAPALAQEPVAPTDAVPPPPEPITAPEAPPLPAASLPSSTVAAGEGGTPAVAPILTVDEEALFAGSAWGKRVKARIDAEGAALQAENDRIAEALAAEEAELTGLRATLEAGEFRQRAEAFDRRATEIRRERAQAAADLNARADQDRLAFYRAALPLMGKLMQERGAVAVLDQRTVFVSLDVIDITLDLIERLDSELGDGAGMAQQGMGAIGTPTPTTVPGTTPAPAPAAGSTAGSDG